MKAVQMFRILEVVILSLVTSLSVTVEARAQDRRLGPVGGDRAALVPAAPQVLIARGVGTAVPAVTEVDADAAGPAPRDLTHEERLTMVGALGLGLTPGTSTWKLTPAQAMITGLADLSFYNVSWVIMTSWPGAPFASMLRRSEAPFNSPTVVLRFYPPVSVTTKRYLIDCKVQTGLVYEVRVYPGDARQTFANTSHLLVLYEAVSAGGAQVDIRLEGSNNDQYWRFYSCEITPLD